MILSGYWMLALDAPCDALFEDIPWSTPEVGRRTMERAHSLGLTLALAPTAYDIDEPAELLRLINDPRCPPSLSAVARSHLR